MSCYNADSVAIKVEVSTSGAVSAAACAAGATSLAEVTASEETCIETGDHSVALDHFGLYLCRDSGPLWWHHFFAPPRALASDRQKTLMACRGNLALGRAARTGPIVHYQGARSFGNNRSRKIRHPNCIRVVFRCRFKQRTRRAVFMRSISKTIAWLCLLLTFLSAVAFVVHHHSSATEAAKCTVCVAAHSASPKTACILPHTTFIPVATFREKPVSTKQRLTAFALCVRPPPSV
jgi:hypothetical protein